MTDQINAADEAAVSSDALRKAEEFIEQEEGAANRLAGWTGTIVTAIAIVCTLFHLYVAVAGSWPLTWAPLITTQDLRYTHVAFVLVLSFLLFPVALKYRNHIRWWDVIPAVAAVFIIGYAVAGGEDFTDRATLPLRFDVIVGVIFIVILLEATRRATGWIMPGVAIAFIAYAMLGPHLPP